ncbi:MAG: hypothetical protein DI535_16895 [Citrobacter freundii]|nr:MAG: hypothetical protein DI535_16895 [Citrobacter freundii]
MQAEAGARRFLAFFPALLRPATNCSRVDSRLVPTRFFFQQILSTYLSQHPSETFTKNPVFHLL